MTNPIFLITGTPGAGKSTTARALMKHFPLGVHLPVDDVREWVVSGIAHPVPQWTQETARQFALARQSAAYVARLYHKNGFAAAIDDVISVDDARLFDVTLANLPFYRVLLHPSIQSALERNASRTNKNFDTSILVETIRRLHQNTVAEQYQAANWIVIDNSAMTVEETAHEILRQIS